MVKYKSKAHQIVERYGWERALRKKYITLGGKGYHVVGKPTKKGLRHLKQGVIYVSD